MNRHHMVRHMQRQLTHPPHELWHGQGVCIIAIDAIESNHPEAIEGVALLDGNTVFLAFGSDIFVFPDLPPAVVSTIKLGQSGVVEFGPEGPRRETPIALV